MGPEARGAVRFLVVYKDYVPEAKNLLAELGITDVAVIACGREKSPRDAAEQHLRYNPGAEVAFVGVNKKYRRTVDREFDCSEAVSVESVLGGRRSLEAWLRPAGVQAPTWLRPTEAFQRAAESQPRLRLANGALNQADRIAERRVPFANRAAAALEAYAAAGSSAPEGLPQFFAERGVNFATGGMITATYQVRRNGKLVETKATEWHLKEGDATTADDAARVYFHNAEGLVVILRCGPHPSEDFSVDIELPS